jgi:excisionase family DNA binding protein
MKATLEQHLEALASIEEAAVAVGCSSSNVHELVRRGELVSVRLGGRCTKITRASIGEYLKKK